MTLIDITCLIGIVLSLAYGFLRWAVGGGADFRAYQRVQREKATPDESEFGQ